MKLPSKLPWFPQLSLVLSIWTILAFIRTYADYHSAIAALRSDRAATVEGRRAFQADAVRRHAMESFTVSGQRFS
jgi:hypothetical protein